MNNFSYLLLVICSLLLACGQTTKQQTNATQQATPINTPTEPTTQQQPINRVDTTIHAYTIDEIMGKFVPSKHPDFAKVDAKYANKSGMYLRKATYESFVKMHEAAKKDGISLKIISATRPFDHQKRIWEAKWTGSRLVGGKDLSKAMPNPKERALKILEYSSMPGSSRHHWGTDLDINALENSYFESGQGLKEYEWLTAHAHEYGFCQPYSPKNATRPNGYNEEKWHWSYLPIAQPLTQLAQAKLTNKSISGFEGAEAATAIDVVNNYILGINPACK